MHDDLTGTSIPGAYAISWNDELLALNRFATVLTDAVSAVSRGLDTRGEGTPLVVFNPLSVARQDAVEATVDLPGSALRVLGPDGEGVPCQERPLGDGRRRLVFLARVPALGFAVYQAVPAAAAKPTSAELVVSERGLENQRYRVRLDDRGDVASIRDKQLDRELLAGPLRLALLADRSPRWPAWEIQWQDISSLPREWVSGPAAVRVVETGPARVALEVERQAGRSSVRQRLRLAAGGDLLECETEIDWRTRGRLLKAVFPLAAANPRATFDLGLGAIERGNARPGKYEVPAQQWADLTDASGEFGVSILSDSRYGWDKPDDRTLRLSLVRSPWTWRKFLHQSSQDHGHHQITWALAAHAGSWADGGTAWQAARLNQPLLAFAAAAGPGVWGSRLSLLTVSDPAVAVRAFKLAEDGDGWVLRLQELHGRPAGEVTVESVAPITTATEVDGMEEPLSEPRLGGPVRLAPGRFEPRSFKLVLGPTVHRAGAPASQPVELAADLPAAGGQDRPVDFDGAGRSFPARPSRCRSRSSAAGCAFSSAPAAAPAAAAARRWPYPRATGSISGSSLARSAAIAVRASPSAAASTS